jgi:hypothetical protein
MRFDLLSLKLFVTVCEQQNIARGVHRAHGSLRGVQEDVGFGGNRKNAPLSARSEGPGHDVGRT